MHTKTLYITGLMILAFIMIPPVMAQQAESSAAADPQIDQPLYKPLIERYILDELKQVRQDQLMLRSELAEKLAAARLDASDRAIRYTADTTNTIFYIITAAASLLVVLGWKSLRDIKDNIESVTSIKLAELTQEYEHRLNELEVKIKQRSEQIIATQEEISNTNLVHSLWMRAGLEKSEAEKINIYDQILELNPVDVEALTYKASALLDGGETKWALSLANQAIEHDSEYALAYWHRACANAELEREDEAIADITTAIRLADSFKDAIGEETHFQALADNPAFQQLLEEHHITS
ncbi:MAG: hypothetical protein Tsb002_15740 [Wenzhouxiangellaceae bacterium]